MSGRKVTTQAGLDAALTAKGVTEVYVESPAGVWLNVSSDGGRWVEVRGSATVSASDSATVRAYGSATVHAYGSATVSAYDSATVSAYGSATVRAYDSATVRAYDSATVRAYGSATVRASGSATVSASGSATVRAYGSATVRAYGSATVRAYDSATVRAYDSATVSASKYVAVHLHSKRVTLDGGVVIDVTDIDKHTAKSWLEWQGVPITRGSVVVYKAVNAELRSGHGMAYPIGESLVDPQWKATDACGAGLHFGASPAQAEAYYSGSGMPRFLACKVKVKDLVGITGHPTDTAKCKARACVVLYEVDVHGRKLEATS